MTDAVDRESALRLLCDMVELAIAAEGTTSELRLIAWLDARGESEGGFLWLAGALGYRPTQLDAMLRPIITAAPRRRQAIARRLTMLYWNALNE